MAIIEVIKPDNQVEHHEEPGSEDIVFRIDVHKSGALVIWEEVLVAPVARVWAAYAPGTWLEVHWIQEEDHALPS